MAAAGFTRHSPTGIRNMYRETPYPLRSGELMRTPPSTPPSTPPGSPNSRLLLPISPKPKPEIEFNTPLEPWWSILPLIPSQLQKNAPITPKRPSSKQQARQYISLSTNNQRLDLYCKTTLLGRGTSSEVWVATRDDKRFALKIVPYSSGALVCHEYEISRKLRQYRFIVYVHEAWIENSFLYILTELCEKNLFQALSDHVKTNTGLLPEDTVLKYLANLVQGLHYMHERHILHLDIKPENCFVVDGVCKLGDLGSCWEIVSSFTKPASKKQSTVVYMAPDDQLSYYSDVYSLGLTIFQVMSLRSFKGSDAVLSAIKDGWLKAPSAEINIAEKFGVQMFWHYSAELAEYAKQGASKAAYHHPADGTPSADALC